jgi:hypothetical protein
MRRALGASSNSHGQPVGNTSGQSGRHGLQPQPQATCALPALWAFCLVLGFAAIHWSTGTNLADPHHGNSFGTSMFFSGETFFTLGLGDVAPTSTLARVVTVVEAGTGFGFLALVIGYLPVLYQCFARRELAITLLDARASSPPSAGELLRRIPGDENLIDLLRDWERWSADLLESHLSYPVLAYFRSHHDHQSWLAMLTVVLDTSAALLASERTGLHGQAKLTFAMARHTAVDLAQVLRSNPDGQPERRLPPADTWAPILPHGVQAPVSSRLALLRDMYEPYCSALSKQLALPLPEWLPSQRQQDDWETTVRGS